MKALKLKDGITWIGSLDPNLKVFDIIMETKYGSSYNSYIVKGEEKIVLFETVKLKFYDEYIEKVSDIVDMKKIDYIIVEHTEPDHVGSLEKILDLIPNITIVGTNAAIKYLKKIVNKDFNSLVVKDKDTIDLGGKTLEFITAPFLHWPDTMYTYIKEDKTIITCDSFGAHYCFDEMLLSKVINKDEYMESLEFYFDVIMGPFKKFVLSAINKIKDLEIDMILPGHGPVIDENPLEIVDLYKKWATEENIFDKKTIIISYVSAYGFTKLIAEALKKGIELEKDVNVLLYDMEVEDTQEVINKLKYADGMMFGSPTLNSDALEPIWDILMNMSPLVHGRKLVAGFGSYGWSGEAVPNMEARFKMLRLKQFEDGIKINFKPSDDEIIKIVDYGKRFAQAVLGK
ncbi:MAG: FprA family A-type flavoprotein [Bacillota bacterium]|nr:FprA family A-type flavoprotein [Bacillota bacterium]